MLLDGDAAVVVPWVSDEQLASFLDAWGVRGSMPEWLVLQRDERREGTGATKNKGVARALEAGADVVVILDDDCFPDECRSLPELVAAHIEALTPQPVRLFEQVTDPPSRGTPYEELHATLPVAASMGFWTDVGDYCAVRQLAHRCGPMQVRPRTIFWRWFALCGMNLAFRPREWLPWCRFIETPRYDDIWMGWLWQREAYRRGCCFNLHGPCVRHARQSNVWKNLAAEARHLEANETLWREIALSDMIDYDSLRRLLPCLADHETR